VEFTRTFEDSKEYHYKIEIEEVYKRTLLDIGDELAKTVNSEYENLEQLKAALENEGNEIYEKEMLDFLRKQALDQFVDLVEFDISDKTLDFLVDQAIEKMKSDREYEKMLSQYDNDEGKLRKALRDYYEWDLKMNYGIEKVARENDLKVTEEDLQAEADNLALSWGVSSERARSIVKNRENIRKELEWELLKRKVADLILNKAKVIEVKPEELAQKEDKEDKKEVDQSEE
ncbi:MAG TPA: trigger factor, partial [Kosmotoga arenicorallina]|nr:trigger factor [Kosmotoga arenicorallina]